MKATTVIRFAVLAGALVALPGISGAQNLAAHAADAKALIGAFRSKDVDEAA